MINIADTGSAAQCRLLAATSLFLFTHVIPGILGNSNVNMLTKPQSFDVAVGETVSLTCEFADNQFNLFDNPIVWRKHQRFRQRVPVSSHAENFYNADVAEGIKVVEILESTQVNMMGNVIEPFSSTGRFKASFHINSTSFVFGLTIHNVSLADIGSYTCEVGGPQNTIVANVTHHLSVRANVDELIITDSDFEFANFMTYSINASILSMTSSHSAFSKPVHRQVLVYVEGRPSSLRCIAVGGNPAPSLRLQVLVNTGVSGTGSGRYSRDDAQDVTVEHGNADSGSSIGHVTAPSVRRKWQWFSEAGGDVTGLTSLNSSSAAASRKSTSFLWTSAEQGRRGLRSSRRFTALGVASNSSSSARHGGASTASIQQHLTSSAATTVNSQEPTHVKRRDEHFNQQQHRKQQVSVGRLSTAASVAGRQDATAAVGSDGRMRSNDGPPQSGSAGTTTTSGDGTPPQQFSVGLHEDGAEVRCTATVPGLPSRVATSRIIVQYVTVVECFNGTATLDEKNVNMRCEIKSRPEVTSLRWVIDDNGTTISEGHVVDNCWTLVMDRTDGILETQLYVRQAVQPRFRRYTLFVDNGVTSAVAYVWLHRKTQKHSRPDNVQPDFSSSYERRTSVLSVGRTCRLQVNVFTQLLMMGFCFLYFALYKTDSKHRTTHLICCK